MIKLKPEDRIRVVKWLSELREFEAEANRRRLLELAGLDAVAAQIDVSGAPLMAAASVVDFLARYGRPNPDAEALGLLLNLICSFVSAERQQEIAAVLRAYSMTTPVAPSPPAEPVGARFKSETLNEKIIGQNTLRAVAFLARGLRAAKTVGLVRVEPADAGPWVGSGFLVGPDLFLTNFHVVRSAADASATTIVFDYEEDEFGRMRQTNTVKAVELLASDEGLDYSLLRLATAAGRVQGWLPLRAKPVGVGDRVNIIQHPGGQPKQVALQHNIVEYVGGNVVQYVTSTLPGSSGSPVLDDSWVAVALHHAGGTLSEPTTGNSYYRNEGVLISAILAKLSPAIAARISAIAKEAVS